MCHKVADFVKDNAVVPFPLCSLIGFTTSLTNERAFMYSQRNLLPPSLFNRYFVPCATYIVMFVVCMIEIKP